MNNFNINLNNLETALLELNQELAEKIVLRAAKASTPVNIAGTLISDVLKKIGDTWENGSLALSQVYMSSVMCEKIIDKILLPQSPDRKDQPHTAIGVFEDYHMLGKRIVASTLRAAGIELIDLGGGLTIEKIIQEVEQKQIKILMLSVLMLPSALRIKELSEKLKPYKVILIVGGAPFRFDNELFNEIGADYYGKDSAEALTIVSKLMDEIA